MSEQIVAANATPRKAPGGKQPWVALSLILFASISSSGVLLQRMRNAATETTERLTHSTATTFTGKIKPASQVTLAAAGPSTVRQVLVQIGSEVQVGQSLVVLDDSAAHDAFTVARLEQVAAEQEVAYLERTYRQVDRTLTNTSADLAEAASSGALAQRRADLVPTRQWRDSPERAQAAYDNAAGKLERMRQLRARGLVSDQDVDDAAMADRIAANDLANARRWEEAVAQAEGAHQREVRLQLQRTRAADEQRRAQASAAMQQARLKAAQAAERAQIARRLIDGSTVKATAPGVVVDLPIKVGDQVPTGALLVRVAALRELTVEVSVDARLINALHVGEPATVSIPTIPPRQVTGSIALLNPIPAPNMTHVVEVRFANDSGFILAGQPAEVVFRR